jgi:hypothetical protein
MDQNDIEAAAQKIADNLRQDGNLLGAITRMWVDSGHDTALMEAAYARYQETRMRSDRVADMTLAQVGEVIFMIAPTEDGSGWAVNSWWGGEDPHRDEPAGEATAPTIEQGLAAALKDMTEDVGEDDS